MPSSPARLHKKAEDMSLMTRIEIFLNRHVNILLPILILMLLFFIIVLVLAFIDMSSAHNVVMVESGNYYNHLKDVI